MIELLKKDNNLMEFHKTFEERRRKCKPDDLCIDETLRRILCKYIDYYKLYDMYKK